MGIEEKVPTGILLTTVEKLVNWIVREKPELKEIESDIAKKFKDAFIIGSVFLNHDGDTAFFEEKCGLPIGACEILANLASETKGKKSK